MKIGIVVYSQTGNTQSVASKLYDKLKDEGMDVALEKIEAKRDMKRNPQLFDITNSPKLEKYNFLVLASYVEAFMLCPVMKKYLENIPSQKNKKALCFITHHFPYKWLGGNNAIRQMTSLCKSKNIIVKETGIVNWKNKNREQEIDNIINSFYLSIKNN